MMSSENTFRTPLLDSKVQDENDVDEDTTEQWRGSLSVVPVGKKTTSSLQKFDTVEDLYRHSLNRLKLTSKETTVVIEKGMDSFSELLKTRGNVFEHTGGYRAGKWLTHIGTLGMNRARRWTIFPGEVGMALHVPSNTIYQLPPGQHYLRPLVYGSAQQLTLPTGLEARPSVSYLGRVHIVRVRPGDIVLITVNGVQRLLGKGFHFIEAKNFVFNAKHFLAKTNFIQHGNVCRVFVPRGCAFTAVVDQQPILLPHRSDNRPYFFNTPRFQLPRGKPAAQCFVRIGVQDIEHRSIRVFLVPKGYRVFAKYRGDPLVFEHNPMPYVIDDPLFQWGSTSFSTSRIPLSVSYVGLLGLHYIRVPKGQLLLVMVNGRVSAVSHDPKLGEVPKIFRSPNLQPIAFVTTAQRFIKCATWNRILVTCGQVCLAWLKNKAVRLEARAEPHIVDDDDCFRLRQPREEAMDSTTASKVTARTKTTKQKSSFAGVFRKAQATRSTNDFLQSEVPSLLSVPNSYGVVIQPGIGWDVLDQVDVAFKPLSSNYHHGRFCQKTVNPGEWGIARVNAKVVAFLDRFVSDNAGDFKMIGTLPAVEQLIELSLKDVRAADHRLNIKVDFIFKIVDAQKALRSLIPVKMINNWKVLLEERAKSVVTALLPRVQSNLTIRNLGGPQVEKTTSDNDSTHPRGTFAENFNAEVKGSWGQTYINKAFVNNGVILVSFTPSEVHLTDAQTKKRLEESAREASLQEMEVAKIQKSYEAKAQKIATDMELQKMQQRLELMKIENEKLLQEQRAALAVQTAEAESRQNKIRADASAYAAEKSKESGAFTQQQLEVEKLKIIAQCFAGQRYTGPQMMMQQQALVANMLRNMGMSSLVPSMTTDPASASTSLSKDSKEEIAAYPVPRKERRR